VKILRSLLHELKHAHTRTAITMLFPDFHREGKARRDDGHLKNHVYVLGKGLQIKFAAILLA
jgi:hypothetical protein